jgi:hypothetical protein
MLASITPLGERSRGFSWALTASAFAVGTVTAGALAGAAATLAVDATPMRSRLPTTRRQVNEDWLTRYRGWVYGVAFGAQLGAGVVTVVTSAAIYAAALGAVLSGTPVAGTVVGAAFGATRALALVPAHGAADPVGLVRLHDRLGRAEAPARMIVVAAEVVAVAVVAGGLVGGRV